MSKDSKSSKSSKASKAGIKRNTWLDGVMGVAVGDALGLPVQFLPREELILDPVKGMLPCDLFDSPIGTWSDDTAMTLAMLDSIKTLGKVDAQDIMENFVRWLNEAEYTANHETIDEGNTCAQGILNYVSGQDIYSCGKTGEHANGNGSLMRTLPICLYYAEKVHNGEATLDDAIKDIHLVSALTHNHIRACIACGLYYFAVAAILYEEGSLMTRLQKGMNEGFKYYGSSVDDIYELTYYGWFMDLEEMREATEAEIRSTGYVVDSFEAAIWCLITTDSYRDAMLKAANLGDDTDTIAAIAGGLAGLYYGYESIPKEWLEVLRRREWIEERCRR